MNSSSDGSAGDTGKLNKVPDIPGVADVRGTRAHTCPYCDGFEHRDVPPAILTFCVHGEHIACRRTASA